MESKIIKGNSPTEIQLALDNSLGSGFKPTLAIITLSETENAEDLRTQFDQHSIKIFGITAPQKFTGHGIDEHNIVVMLLDMNPDHFRIVLNEYHDSSAYEAGLKTGKIGKETFTNPGFIISPIDFRMSGDEVIKGLTESAGKEVPIMGGVAGNPKDFSGILFNNSSKTNAGILALIIDRDKVMMNGLAVSGRKPVGTSKKITKSKGAWVYSIDDQPAVNVIKRFLGEEIITDEKQGDGLLPSDLGYPLQFERASGNAIMKPVIFWNTADQSIMVGSEVKEGESFRFSLPPDFDAIDIVVGSTQIIKEKSMPEIDALLIFSCIGRLGTFGPMISSEIEGLSETWKKPMLGFFSLGEFGKLDDGPSEFHGTTVSWVALKEK